jgi:hypothetical protein
MEGRITSKNIANKWRKIFIYYLFIRIIQKCSFSGFPFSDPLAAHKISLLGTAKK